MEDARIALESVASGLSHLSDVMAGTAPEHVPLAFWQWWVVADPLAGAVLVSLAFAAGTYLLSLPTNQHSWVDKIWSLLPILYIWHFATHDQLLQSPVTEPLSPRLLAMAVLITAWGVRLTYNFYRKGGYSLGPDGEDYRWPILRASMHPALFQIFSITFISLIQNLLLLAIVAPAYVAWRSRLVPFGPLDAAAAMLALFFIVFEAVADQQQWLFQTEKARRRAGGKRLTGEYAKGFLTSGLWQYSRHPNFFAEQCFWWSIYLFSVAATGQWLNWTIAGPALLTLLFQGSTHLTEKVTAGKYPQYRKYQATVSRILPWWPAASPKRGRRAAAATTPATTRKTRAQEKEGAESSEGEEAAAAAVTPAAVAAAKTPATGRRTAARARTGAKAAETPGVRTSQRLRARAARE